MDYENQLGIFHEEVGELLGVLETTLLSIEKDPANPELLDTVFRIFHTIKGSSGMFGLDEIARFTHEIESEFDLIRKGKRTLDDRMIRYVLEAKDRIQVFIDSGDSPDERMKRAGILAGLRPSESVVDDRPAADGYAGIFRIFFKPPADILMRGYSPGAIFSELRSLGDCRISPITEDLPPLADFDPERCYLKWMIVLSTRAAQEAISDVFIFIEDQSDLTITPITTDTGATGIPVKRIGEILVEHGSLDPARIPEITAEQKPFGGIALEKGLTNTDRIEGALAEQEFIKSKALENHVHSDQATIRVRNDKLDLLMNLVGELVAVQARFEQEAGGSRIPKFITLAETLGRLTNDLRANAMSIRMVPVSELWGGFSRLVHDLAHELSKDIRLETSGGETELDKSIIGSVKDALVHLIRNSADHGIEKPEDRLREGKPAWGTIRLNAGHSGSSVRITVEDDGAGLDRERIRVKAVEKGLIGPSEQDDDVIFSTIFLPGFSTSERTTSISGRGVGMDAVKCGIERLRGTVGIGTKAGRGTQVSFTIPLTLAIMDGLLARIAGNHYILNLSQVEECVDLTDGQRISGHGRNVLMLRDGIVPFLVLREEFRLGPRTADIECVIVMRVDGTRIGLVADRVIGKIQTVIKPLPGNYTFTNDVSGSAILGDGSIALILDAEAIVKSRYDRIMES